MSTRTMDCDLIVVGFGAAGSAAALTAAEHGASVIILEKQSAEAHTPSTLMSGGLMLAARSVAEASRYLNRCSTGLVPPDVSFMWAQRAAQLRAWLETRLGLDLRVVGGAEHPELEGSTGVEVLQIAPRNSTPSEPTGRLSLLAAGMDPAALAGTGVELFDALRHAIDSHDRIEVVYGARARRLIKNESGRVTGVEYEYESNGVSARSQILGAKGVVLTCGGYEFDDELKANSLKAPDIHFYGSAANTGDGVRMAMDAGAALWHMNQMVGRAVGHFRREDNQFLNVAVRLGPPGYVLLDRDGRRFANEAEQAAMAHGFYNELVAYSSTRLEYPRIPAYWIFDERRRSAGPLVSTLHGAVRVGHYDWSTTNQREIASGWILQADSIEELARIAGIRYPAVAADSIAAYNAACREGTDPFGRPAESLVPIDSAPYYCVPVYPGGSNTSGGPKRDQFARVIGALGDPIPGLYAAGELGQAIGGLYPADGANLSEALCFGAIAGEFATAPAG